MHAEVPFLTRKLLLQIRSPSQAAVVKEKEQYYVNAVEVTLRFEKIII